MSPGSHLLISWLIANSPGVEGGRARWAVTAAGVIPDLDGLGVVADLATGRRTDFFHRFHHQIAHNVLAAVAVALLAWAWTRRSWAVAGWALVAFHVHLLCDVIGSKGPDGNQWPIPYLRPFADWEWTWSGQWALNSWQNLAITCGAMLAMLILARRRGFSVLSLFWQRADAVLVGWVRPAPPPRA